MWTWIGQYDTIERASKRIAELSERFPDKKFKTGEPKLTSTKTYHPGGAIVVEATGHIWQVGIYEKGSKNNVR